MSLLPAPALPESFPPYQSLRDTFGCIPALFAALTQVPRLIEAGARICGAILASPGALTRDQKDKILLRVAAQLRCPDDSAGDGALFNVAQALAADRGGIQRSDVERLHACGFSDAHVLDAILTTALARLLCTASSGLDVEQDFVPPIPDAVPEKSQTVAADPASAVGGPYLSADDVDPDTFSPFEFFRNTFGFVPNVFRAQALRPDVLEAEAALVDTVLQTADVLTRVQKESILVAISAANLNAYCVALHSEMLGLLGVEEDTSERIAGDHHQSDLAAADKALLDFALRVASGARSERKDIDRLRSHAFSDEQILEAVIVTAFTCFLNTVQRGLGTVPDFAPRRSFSTAPQPSAANERADDPDFALVERARQGDPDGFEELVRRHHRRIFRAAVGITGNYEDAEDVAQIAFVKAFQGLSTFERHARFTTWLTRIAINEALTRVRARRPSEELRLETEDRGEFKPSILGAWVDSPEQVYARAELRALVERALAELPVKYRLPVLLRDVEQLSTTEAASALGLAVPTLKKHLLRGRLLLREALAPHFLSGQGAVTRV